MVTAVLPALKSFLADELGQLRAVRAATVSNLEDLQLQLQRLRSAADDMESSIEGLEGYESDLSCSISAIEATIAAMENDTSGEE